MPPTRSRRQPRKRDKRKVKSLWHTYAPAAWWPVTLDEAQVRSLSAAYSLRELRQMAAQLGIDAHLSKIALARCIVAEKNIFFPNEAGNYDHNTLVYLVRQFQVLPELSDQEALALNNVELQSVLLNAWKGGTDEAMNINLQHVLELYDIMQAMEDKFCSSHVKKLFRDVHEDGQLSFHDYVENALTAVLDLYQSWLSVEDTKAKRKIFVATQMAYANAEAAVTEYLRMIRKHCQTTAFNDCDIENIPPSVLHWMRTSTWDDRIILCNVTVKGRNVDFAEGDELLPGYRIGVALRVVHSDRENVVWLGLGQPNHAMPELKTTADASGSGGGSSTAGSHQPRPLKHPAPPDYSRPFNTLQLGTLMDLYERQPKAQGQRRYPSAAEPVRVPQDSGVSDPVAQPTALGEPVRVPQGSGVPEPIATDERQDFRSKATALAKDMVGMGMDLAKDIALGLLFQTIFPEPHFTWGRTGASSAAGTSVPVKKPTEPARTDLSATDPVSPETALAVVEKQEPDPLPPWTTLFLDLRTPVPPTEVPASYFVQTRLKSLPQRKYYRIPQDGSVMERDTTDTPVTETPNVVVIQVTPMAGRPRRYRQMIQIPEDGALVEQVVETPEILPSAQSLLVIKVTPISGRPRRYVQTIRIPEDGTLVDQVVTNDSEEPLPPETKVSVVHVTPLRGRPRRYVQTLRIPDDGTLVDQVVESNYEPQPSSAVLTVIHVTPLSGRPRRYRQVIRIPDDGALVEQTVEAAAFPTDPTVEVVQVTPITGRPRRYLQTLRIPEDGTLVDQTVELPPLVPKIPVVQIIPLRGRPRRYVQTVRIPEDGTLAEQVVDMAETEVAPREHVPTLELRSIPTYRIPDDGQLVPQPVPGAQAVDLLAGVPRVQVTPTTTRTPNHPLAMVPQYAKEPDSVSNDHEVDPQATFSSTDLATVPAAASSEWQIYYGRWIYDMLRQRTPQGYPFFPIVVIPAGTSDQEPSDLVSPDLGAKESPQTPVFRPDSQGSFRLSPVLPSGTKLTQPEEQPVLAGTFCPSPALEPLLPDLTKVQQTPAFSNDSSLQAHASQLEAVARYRPHGPVVSYVNVSTFLWSAQTAAASKKNSDKALIDQLIRDILAKSVTITPVRPASDDSTQGLDITVVPAISGQRQHDMYSSILSHVTPTLLVQLETLRRNSRSSILDQALRRFMNNLRFMALQTWLFRPNGQRSTVTPSALALPQPTINPFGLAHWVSIVRKESSDVRNFYHVDSAALTRLAQADLSRLTNALEQSKVFWKDMVGGYTSRGGGDLVPYSSVRAVNLWDTWINVTNLFSTLDPSFVQALLHLNRTLPADTDPGPSSQAVRDLQALGLVVSNFQSRIRPRSVVPTADRPEKITVIDAHTAVDELQQDARYRDFLTRYRKPLQALVVWQDLHLQETSPWKSTQGMELFREAERLSDWTSLVVYVQLSVDPNQHWRGILGELQKSQDELRQAANTVLRLGSWLNSAQLALSLPSPLPPPPVHNPDYNAQLHAFEDYTRQLLPMLQLPSPPQQRGNRYMVILQPDLRHLIQTTETTVQSAERVLQRWPKVISVREAAQAYIEQAVLFRTIMNRMFSNQAQCRVGTIDLPAAHHSLALAPDMVTVHVASSVLQNALAHVLKDTGVTVDDVANNVAPSHQLVVYQALDMAQRARPVMPDTSEPPSVFIIPNMFRVGDLLNKDPVASRHRGFQLVVQNIFSKFPQITDPGSVAPTASAARSVLGGQTALTHEFGKFPVVPVPRPTVTTAPTPRVEDLRIRMPDPPVSPFDVPVVVPPGWFSQGPVPVKVYPQLPSLPASAGELVVRAKRVFQSGMDALQTGTTANVRGIGQALDLWTRMLQCPGPVCNVAAPDYWWLNKALRQVFDDLSQQPLSDHGLTQQALASAQQVVQVIESSGLQNVPAFHEATLTCPVLQAKISTRMAQTLLSTLRDTPTLPPGVAPSVAAAQAFELTRALQGAYGTATPDLVDDKVGWITLPDFASLWEGWSIPAGLKTLEQLKADWQASQQAEHETERAAAMQHHLKTQENLNQARGLTYNAMVWVWTTATGLYQAVEALDRKNRELAQEQRRLRAEQDAQQDARNYEIWKKKVWDGLWQSPAALQNALARNWATAKRTADWSWYLFSNALSYGVGVPLQVTWYLGGGFVNGLLTLYSERYSAWKAIYPEVSVAVSDTLKLLESSVAVPFQAAWEALSSLPERSDAAVSHVLGALSAAFRSAWNVATAFVATTDVLWTSKVLDYLKDTDKLIQVATGALQHYVALAQLQVQRELTILLKLGEWMKGLTKHVEAFARHMVIELTRPKRLKALYEQYGRDPSLPLDTFDDEIMGGFCRDQMKQGVDCQFTGEVITAADTVRRKLERYGIEVGSAYSALPASSGAGIPTQGPTLVGPVTLPLEGLVSSNAVHNPGLKSRSVSRASIRRLRRSERVRIDNMNALFHKKTGTPVVELTLRSTLPSSHLAAQTNPQTLDQASQATTAMLHTFLTDSARHVSKGHAAHSVRDHIQDQLETVANALLAEPAKRRPVALVETFHGLGEDLTLDAVVCLTAALGNLVNGFYSMVYRQDLKSYCFTRTWPLTVVAPASSGTASKILSDPAAIGVIMDPSWRAHDAESVLRSLAHLKYPSTPFCLVGDTSGPAGTAQCIPIFTTSVPVSGASMLDGVAQIYDLHRLYAETILTTALTAVAYVEHATVNPLDQALWASIVSRTANVATTMGAPLEVALANLLLVNQYQTPQVRLPEDQLKTLVIRSVAQGPDPLATEYFKLPFRVSPVTPVLIAWQKDSGLTNFTTDLALLERNGIYGPALLMHFRDWLLQHASEAVNIYDSYLQATLTRTTLDRNLLLLDSLRWLNRVGVELIKAQQNLPDTRAKESLFSTPSPLGVPPSDSALFSRPTPKASPEAFLQDYRQEFLSALGQPFTRALAARIPELTFAAQTFLDHTNTSGFFDMCALTLFARSRVKRWLEVDVTPALWGTLMLQANTSSLLCQRIPKLKGDPNHMDADRSLAWQGITRVVRNASESLTVPFRFNSHIRGDEVSTCQAEPLVRSSNYSHAAITQPWSMLQDRVRHDIAEGLERLKQLQRMVNDPKVAATVAALADPVSKDMLTLHRINGTYATAQCWDYERDWPDVLPSVATIAAENTALLENTDQEAALGAPDAVVQAEDNPYLDLFVYRSQEDQREVQALANYAHNAKQLGFWGAILSVFTGISSEPPPHGIPPAELKNYNRAQSQETQQQSALRTPSTMVRGEQNPYLDLFVQRSPEDQQEVQALVDYAKHKKEEIPILNVMGSVVNYALGMAKLTAIIASPATALPPLIVTNALRLHIAQTTWWKETQALLERQFHPAVLFAAQVGGEVLITFAIGRVSVTFSQAQLPSYERLLYESPLEVFMRAGSLHHQLETAGVDATTKKVVEALGQKDLFVAAQNVLGTTPEAIRAFIQAYQDGNLNALSNFVHTFSVVGGAGRTWLLDAIRLSALFSDRADVTNLRPDTLAMVTAMAEHARRKLNTVTQMAPFAASAGAFLWESQVAVARSLLALVDRLAEGNGAIGAIEGLREQLQHVPVNL